MVGRQVLALVIGVRVPAPEPIKATLIRVVFLIDFLPYI